MTPTEYPHIFINTKGVPCVSGTRFKVEDVVAERYLQGLTPEAIVEGFEPFTAAEIYSALAYYHDHREAMDQQIEERERRAEAERAEIEVRQGPSLARAIARAREEAHARGLQP